MINKLCSDCFHCKCKREGNKMLARCKMGRWWNGEGEEKSFILHWNRKKTSWWTSGFTGSLKKIASMCVEFEES